MNPYLRRWMLFVDGESMTIRGQKFAERQNAVLPEGPWFKRDTYLWFPPPNRVQSLTKLMPDVQLRPDFERALYYTSAYGDSDERMRVRETLRALRFTPEVFPKIKNEKGKGVDIALTKDLLSNAFLDNYDAAVIVTGDADYLPVIQELKRIGKVTCLLAFEHSGAQVNPELRLAVDWFFGLDQHMHMLWSGLGILPVDQSWSPR